VKISESYPAYLRFLVAGVGFEGDEGRFVWFGYGSRYCRSITSTNCLEHYRKALVFSSSI